MSSTPPLAILAAFPEEISAVVRALEQKKRVQTPGGAFLSGRLGGKEVVLALTGLGARAARMAADGTIRATGARLIVSTGFAGGLQRGLARGDLVVADEVLDPPSPDGDGPREWSVDPDLLGAVRGAARDGLRLEQGRFVVSKRVLATAAEKEDYGRRHGAIAVDMESGGIARAANVHDARVIFVRVILDELAYHWPMDFTPLLTPQGKVRPLRLLGALLKRPGRIPALLELRERSARCAAALAEFIAALVPLLPSEVEAR